MRAWPRGRGVAALFVGLAMVIALPAGAASALTPGSISEMAGGPGSGAALGLGQNDAGVAVSSSGNLYLADQLSNVIREQKIGSAAESVVAGNGLSGNSGTGGPAKAAELNQPGGIAIDHHNNVVVADSGNGLIRVIAATTGTFYGQLMTAHDIYTVAGGGVNSGSGVPATSVFLFQPGNLVVDQAGNIVLAETQSNVVRVVAVATGTFYGISMVSGDIYTVAGTGTSGYSGDGGSALSADFKLPNTVTLDHHGNLVIADTGNNVVRVVAETTASFYGVAMTAGDVYTVAGTGSGGYTGDGGPATAATLNQLLGVAVDGSGNLVVADSHNSVVRVVAARTASFYGVAMHDHDIYTVAGDGTRGFSGDGGPATSAELFTPAVVAFDHSHNLVIGDVESFGRATGHLRLVAVAPGTYFGQTISGGNITSIAGDGILGSTNDGSLATNASLSGPQGAVTDAHGNIVFSDSQDSVVRVVAGQTGTFFGQSMTAGRIYTIAGDGSPGFAGDGGPATASEVFVPDGVGVDAVGDVVIADYDNFRIRFIPDSSGTYFGQSMTGGDIYTIAGNGGFGTAPSGVLATGPQGFLFNASGAALDSSGNLIIADLGDGLVQVVAKSAGTFYGRSMTAGFIYTVAGGGSAVPGDGGPATSASIGATRAIPDAAGNLILSDSVNYRVRVVAETTGTFYGQSMTAGDIYTIGGDGTFGDSGDGAPAIAAALAATSVTIDSAGDVIVADYFDNVVRMIAETTGTNYGQTMTTGDVYTIAGNKSYGFSGDGGPATAAELAQPNDLTVTPGGNVVIVDTGNARLRTVSGP